MVSPEFLIAIKKYVSLFRSGMAKTKFSKTDCLVYRVPREIHAEDVKEYYYYLDCTPTHSYMKYLYKYPQEEFPYKDLKQENKKRDKNQDEYELIDTGVFDNDRYFDVFIEYSKDDFDDICIKITAHNRSNESAPLHILANSLVSKHLVLANRFGKTIPEGN